MRTVHVSTADDVTYCRPSLSLNEGIMSQETEEEGNVGLEQNSVTWPRMRYEATNLDTANSEFNKSESATFALLFFSGSSESTMTTSSSYSLMILRSASEGSKAAQLNSFSLTTADQHTRPGKAMLAGAGQKQQSYMAVHQL